MDALDDIYKQVNQGLENEKKFLRIIKNICDERQVLTIVHNGTAQNIIDIKKARNSKIEPKADFKVTLFNPLTKTTSEIGISLKMSSFNIFDNWGTALTIKAQLSAIGIKSQNSSEIITKLQNLAAKISNSSKSIVDAEYNAVRDIIENYNKTVPSNKSFNKINMDRVFKTGDYYKTQNLICSKQFNDKIKKAIIDSNDNRFNTTKNNVKTKFTINNPVVSLQSLLDKTSFLNCIELAIAGTGPNKADYVVVADMDDNMPLTKVQAIFNSDKTMSISRAIQYYSSVYNINYRLRPLTIGRTTYSNSNLNRYNTKDLIYEDREKGIIWFVAIALGTKKIQSTQGSFDFDS